jgi:hypothetical protein
VFGWRAAGAERLPGEYSSNMQVRSVPQISRNRAAPLQFLLPRLPPSLAHVSCARARVHGGAPVARMPVPACGSPARVGLARP